MSILDETASVERLQFFNGQRLFAEDLQAIEAFQREMRWLHNLSLHQPGIGNGFAVTGERDDREVHIGPGYAIDARGREIVLTRERTEPIPPVDAEPGGQSVFFDLAVSYPSDDLLEEAETREGICLPRGVVRLREDPVLCWVRLKRDDSDNLYPSDPVLAKDVEDGLRIVIARAEVLACRLRQPVSVAVRRSARPARQPYLACGDVTIPEWEEVLEVVAIPALAIYSLTTTIDTSEAGFFTPPCYSVRFDFERVRIVDAQIESVVADGPPNVVEALTDRFRVNVLATVGRGPDVELPIDFKERLKGWRAVWMGLE
jgi:hypothetical protein